MFNRIKNFLGDTFSTARSGGGEFFLLDNNFGKIYVDTSMIRRIVERIKIDGINGIKAFVEVPAKNDPLNIRLTLNIAQDYSAKDLSSDLVDEIKKILKDDFEITDFLVNIKVNQITQKVQEKKRRVR